MFFPGHYNVDNVIGNVTCNSHASGSNRDLVVYTFKVSINSAVFWCHQDFRSLSLYVTRTPTAHDYIGSSIGRAFVNTRLLVHKHVKISVDEWIMETTRPQKHVKFLEQHLYSINFQSQNQTLEDRKMKNVALFWLFADTFQPCWPCLLWTFCKLWSFLVVKISLKTLLKKQKITFQSTLNPRASRALRRALDPCHIRALLPLADPGGALGARAPP